MRTLVLQINASADTMVLLTLAWVLLCAMPYVTLQLQLNGCGPEHNDVTLCDYAAAKVNNFPSVAFTISMWVKASAPHQKDKWGEGEALFSYNTDRTIANAKYVYRSSEVGMEQELKQLDELKAANKHITETDDSELNDAQKELKEFLLESQHEVSRRKQALKKQVENL